MHVCSSGYFDNMVWEFSLVAASAKNYKNAFKQFFVMPSSQKNKTRQEVIVCQILNLNKIVDHTWFLFQWYVDGEKACCHAPRTTKLEHCISYLNCSVTIKYLTTRRTTARRHGALHGALPRAMSKQKQKLSIILEYSFTNTCSITSGATAQRQDALPCAAFHKNKMF